jgi:hypothetical protein
MESQKNDTATEKQLNPNPRNIMVIPSFCPNTLVINPCILLMAKRCAGKSFMIKHLLHQMYNNKQIDECCVFTHSSASEFYTFTSQVYHEFDISIVEKILAHQREQIKNKIHKNVMIVLDDCVHRSSHSEMFKNNIFLELLFNTRHYNIGIIWAMQIPSGLQPELRQIFDYVFLMAEDNISNQKRMYNHYGGMCPTFNVFEQIFTQLTNNYGSMVIIQRENRIDPYNKLRMFRAHDIKNKCIIPGVDFTPINLINATDTTRTTNVTDTNIRIIDDCDDSDDYGSTKSIVSTIFPENKNVDLFANIIQCNTIIVDFIGRNNASGGLTILFNKIIQCNNMIITQLEK